MLALCFHNCLRYVLPMKLKYPQIWGFYLLAVLIYIFCVSECAYYLANGVDAYQVDHDMYTDLDLGSISYVLSDNFLKCLFTLVTMTMYHLYLGLAFVNQRKSMDTVSKLKKLAEITLWVVYLVILISAIALTAQHHGNKYNGPVAYSNQAFATVNSIIYALEFFYLRREINQLQGMSEERKKIWLQSIVLLISFLSQTIASLVWTLQSRQIIHLSVMETLVFGSTISCLQKCLAPSFIMLAHHKTFKIEKES